jgi:hypothetical protein
VYYGTPLTLKGEGARHLKKKKFCRRFYSKKLIDQIDETNLILVSGKNKFLLGVKTEHPP